MLDNIIIRMLNRIFDLLILNILWVIFSLPIITIGASTTALYAVLLRMAVNKEGYLIREFWKGFKQNFRQSTIIWMLLVIVGGSLGMSVGILHRGPGWIGKIGMFLLGVILVIYVIELIFIFPIVAQFENTTSSMLKNAILIPVSRLPLLLLCLVMDGACVFLTLFNMTTVLVASTIWSLIGVALVAYANSFIMNKIFEPYIP